ncbi:MAG: bifunctional (p)ppGpp synthetase/guanosine-3',5'-bis(diphosphate) 3'-pyrophosphohydrolase [Bacillota bacterium]|nr:bifunctional (p)ppGpp synthetase/guanosine-3',5'-bis(diphosphate) 3'-pyrophosphohydrolase [Bacillota bacterium]
MVRGTLDKLTSRILEANPEADVGLVREAYVFAAQAHEGQTRQSGEAFIRHPLEVAIILAEMELDVESIVAALLHDVVEDTSVTRDEVERRFGKEIGTLVDGVTKLSRIPYQSKEEQQAESLRKMFLAMADDLRVILIKLADRLHNMRTLRHVDEERRKRTARETLEIYAPLAHRLGMSALKWELEDLSFRHLEPEAYYTMVQKVAKKRKEREGYVAEIIDTLRDRLQSIGIEAEVQGRPKHLYSIWNKMKAQGKDFEEIYDLVAVRVIVESVKDCYGVLGLVHTLWKPIPGRFKDYIAMPKSNMYQSLHTTVVGPRGDPMEIQIRTWEMHRTAEYGIAAHWRYKEGKTGREDFEEKIAWLRQLLEWQRETKDVEDFMESLKIDLFEDEVFVFTPKGDVKNLPAGATPVDFAYSVHTDIGHRCIGAKVNGKIVPLNYQLKNGEFVEILTSKTGAPKQDWLAFVKTARARNKIRAFLKEERRGESIIKGRDMLEKEAQRHNLEVAEVLKEARLLDVAKRFGFVGVEDLEAAVGFGKVTVGQVFTRLLGEREWRARRKALREQFRHTRPAERVVRQQGVVVRGVDNVLVRMARCCNPVPGDRIVGYVTRGRGVSVHRVDCPNVRSLTGEGSRAMEVAWDGQELGAYPVEVEVEAIDRANLLADVMNAVAETKTNIAAVQARTTHDRKALIQLTVDIQNTVHLRQIIEVIGRVESVLNVYRANPT